VLALVSGANQLDPSRLAELAGGPVRKADAEAVRRHTGFAIGGVPPIGFPSPIPIFFDRDLLAHQVVWAAAGTPHHVFAIAPSELLRLTRASLADLKAPGI
jgi:prolyl-tRNA editing enzyme YbaK/EbsC (Cys-tRNA(Pro) deacylase)